MATYTILMAPSCTLTACTCLSCHETGKGGALGLTSERHQHVKFTLINNVIKKHGPKMGIATDSNDPEKEPSCKDLFVMADDAAARR